MPGSAATFFSIDFALSAIAGVANVPCLASITIWSASPDADEKFAFKILRARVDSVFGIWNLLEYAVFAPMSAPKNAMKAMSHNARTSLRWLKHHLAIAGIRGGTLLIEISTRR